MKPDPLLESRSHAKYSQSWLVLVSRAVSSHACRRSTWALGLVRSRVGSASLWITPIFVVFELSGPSSLTLPKRSGSSVVPGSGIVPSMLYGPSAARASGAVTTAPARTRAALARMAVTRCRPVGRGPPDLRPDRPRGALSEPVIRAPGVVEDPHHLGAGGILQAPHRPPGRAGPPKRRPANRLPLEAPEAPMPHDAATPSAGLWLPALDGRHPERAQRQNRETVPLCRQGPRTSHPRSVMPDTTGSPGS